jgi:hypothetical protein
MVSSAMRMALVASLAASGALATRLSAAPEEEPRDFGPAAMVARLLASPLARQQEEGEKELLGQGASLRRTLAGGLASSDLREQAIAARLLRVLVSPWARGLEVELNPENLVFQPRRPVERPESHPWAGEIRKIALERLRAILAGKAGKTTAAGAQVSFTYEEFVAAVHLSLLLVEVGDDRTRDEVAHMLSAERRDDSSMFLMYVLECLYGLPPFHEDVGGFCNRGITEEAFKKLETARSARFRAAKDALLTWHARHRAEPEEVILESVLSKHGRDLPDVWISEHPPNDDGSLRFIRLGKAALPSIIERKGRAARLPEKGSCELFIASVTGKADPAVLRDLFAGGDEEKSLACTIVAWAGSKDWKSELEAILRDSTGPTGAAAAALAACHRKGALPALQAAQGANPDVRMGELIRRVEGSAE